MKQKKSIVSPVRIPSVQRLNALARRLHNRVIARPVLRIGIHEVAEHRKVDPWVDVSQRLHLQVREQLLDVCRRGEQCRHDHHRASVWRNPRLPDRGEATGWA